MITQPIRFMLVTYAQPSKRTLYIRERVRAHCSPRKLSTALIALRFSDLQILCSFLSSGVGPKPPPISRLSRKCNGTWRFHGRFLRISGRRTKERLLRRAAPLPSPTFSLFAPNAGPASLLSLTLLLLLCPWYSSVDQSEPWS